MAIRNATLGNPVKPYLQGIRLGMFFKNAKAGAMLNGRKLFNSGDRWIPPLLNSPKLVYWIKSVGNYCLLDDHVSSHTPGEIVAYSAALVRSTVGTMQYAYQGSATQVGDYVVEAGGGSTSFTYAQGAYAVNSALTMSTIESTGSNRGALSAVGKKGGAYALFAGGFTRDRTPWNVSTFCRAYSATLTLSTPTQLSAARLWAWSGCAGDNLIFGHGVDNNNGAVNVVDAYNAALTRSTISSPASSAADRETGSIGGNMVLAGGFDASGPVSDAERYSASLSVSSITGLSEARKVRAAYLPNFLLFAGGRKTKSSPHVLTAKVDTYNASMTRGSAPDLTVPCEAFGDLAGSYGLMSEGIVEDGSGGTVRSAEFQAYIEE
jgi:hypothetical protein